MKAKSCFSTNIDSYRAGIEIGEKLVGRNLKDYPTFKKMQTGK